MSTYCCPDHSSGASRVDRANLCLIAEIVQREHFLLILQQDNLDQEMPYDARKIIEYWLTVKHFRGFKYQADDTEL